MTTEFGRLTCNGCHGFHTGTSGNHIEHRELGEASDLSSFVTDVELPRRVAVLRPPLRGFLARAAIGLIPRGRFGSAVVFSVHDPETATTDPNTPTPQHRR